MNYLKKIFSPFCLIISLLLIIYTFYKSEIYWSGEKSSYYLIYYTVGLSLTVFSIITFFLNQKIKEYLIILSITILATLYLFEGYLIFFQEKQLQKKQLHKEKLYEIQAGKKYDKRTRFKIYSDLKKINNKIVVTVSPNDSLTTANKFFALSGISNSETIYCNENGYYSVYQSDRYGFNNPDDEWDSKEIEYLLVGDSFAHGACVNRPNDIASVLRTLSKKSVLNLGYSGDGPLIEYATLREYLNPKVKKILWLYYEGNDLFNLDAELDNKILTNYLNNLKFSQNLRLKQNEIDSLLKEIIKKEAQKNKEEINKRVEGKNQIFHFFKLFNLRSVLNIYLPEKYRPQNNPSSLKFKKILKLANNLAISNKSKLYFIYLPQYSRYKNKENNSNYFEIKKSLKELDISFIDIHDELFDKEKNPIKFFPWELEGHYTIEGYNKIAKTILKLIND